MRTRLLLVGLITVGVSLLAIDARSTYGARVSSDEPQYLLTAMSLWEDLDLDISDELADERYRPFHENRINQQTYALNDSGQELSPHDPLLSILLAVPCINRLAGRAENEDVTALLMERQRVLASRVRFASPNRGTTSCIDFSHIVDRHCRVHGLANFYIAGSSVFPTAGYINLTLTIVALAVRLAERIRSTLS